MWLPGPLSLLKKGVELFMPVFPSICHAVGTQYPVPKFAASCLIQLRSLIFYVEMLPCFHGLERDTVLFVLEREAASEWVGKQAVG